MKNIIGIWPNLFRAIEVAKTGNFSISVWFDKQEYPNAESDYQTIKDFCKGWFDNFSKKGNINIELTKPPASFFANEHHFETIADIEKRIVKSKQFLLPIWKPDVGTKSLLKNAIEKLDLSLLQIDLIEKISVVIAQMDFSNTVNACHVAEAIQYSHVWDKENKTNFENKAMIIITLKNGIVGIERIATDEEIILKDYDSGDPLSFETKKDELGYYTETEL
jgi:hypothetical protein